VKLEERREAGDVDVIVYDSVRLLDDDHVRVRAGEAPKYHSRRPKGATVIDLRRQTSVIASKVLKAVREEVSPVPESEAHDVTNIPLIMGKSMERGA